MCLCIYVHGLCVNWLRTDFIRKSALSKPISMGWAVQSTNTLREKESFRARQSRTPSKLNSTGAELWDVFSCDGAFSRHCVSLWVFFPLQYLAADFYVDPCSIWTENKHRPETLGLISTRISNTFFFTSPSIVFFFFCNLWEHHPSGSCSPGVSRGGGGTPRHLPPPPPP